MNVRSGGLRETAEKILQQFRLQTADVFRREFPFADQMRPSAEVDACGRKRLVHRHQTISRAQNAALGAERLPDRLAENDACVLDRVVLIHVEVSTRGKFQIHRAVARYEGQHVIEERNSCRDFRAAAAIKIQAHEDVGFRCSAAQFRFSHRQNFSRSFTLCSTASAPNSRSLVARYRCASLPSGRTPKKGTRAPWAARASSMLSPRYTASPGGVPSSSRYSPSGFGFPFVTSSIVMARLKNLF